MKLQSYITELKSKDPEFEKNFDDGYERFKVGIMIESARNEAGLTQEELAERIHTTRSVISRLEKHAESCSIKTLDRIAVALGKKLTFNLV